MKNPHYPKKRDANWLFDRTVWFFCRCMINVRFHYAYVYNGRACVYSSRVSGGVHVFNDCRRLVSVTPDVAAMAVNQLTKALDCIQINSQAGVARETIAICMGSGCWKCVMWFFLCYSIFHLRFLSGIFYFIYSFF